MRGKKCLPGLFSGRSEPISSTAHALSERTSFSRWAYPQFLGQHLAAVLIHFERGTWIAASKVYLHKKLIGRFVERIMQYPEACRFNSTRQITLFGLHLCQPIVNKAHTPLPHGSLFTHPVIKIGNL